MILCLFIILSTPVQLPTCRYGYEQTTGTACEHTRTPTNCIYMTVDGPIGTYVPGYLHTHIHLLACIHMYTYLHVYLHACTHACMHAYMHASSHTCMHTYVTVQSFIHSFVRSFTHLQAHSSMKLIRGLNDLPILFWGIPCCSYSIIYPRSPILIIKAPYIVVPL